jgi:multiple sugar transport system substrate-binding protein
MAKRRVTRREFLAVAGAATVGGALAACAPAATPTAAPAPPPTSAPAAPPTSAPAVVTPKKVQFGILEVNKAGTQKFLDAIDFKGKTGLDYEIVTRSDTKETELARLAAAIQAGTSPYDIIDFEDELATTLSRSGYVIGIDDLLPSGFWDDFSPAMVAYTKTWSTYQGQTFRIVHNWEFPYWWYRKDWFTAKGVNVPTTWQEVEPLGKVFTDTSKGVWASIDGLIKGAFLNVYLAWITLQAGGNPFDVGDAYKTALQYIYDLMYTYNVLNPASLQTDYNQQNAAYFADKVAFMRQWPFVGDVARSSDNAKWFSEDKLAVAVPPVGPGGKGGSTYAAAWGFGIVKTAPHMAEAKIALPFVLSTTAAPVAMQQSYWYLNARKSVLAAADPTNWLVKQMKMYTDAAVIGVRPFHPRFVEALTVLEDTAAAYLTKQITLDQSLSQAKSRLAALS